MGAAEHYPALPRGWRCPHPAVCAGEGGDRAVEEAVECLPCKCPFEHLGCTEELIYATRAAHAARCPFNPNKESALGSAADLESLDLLGCSGLVAGSTLPACAGLQTLDLSCRDPFLCFKTLHETILNI